MSNSPGSMTGHQASLRTCFPNWTKTNCPSELPHVLLCPRTMRHSVVVFLGQRLEIVYRKQVFFNSPFPRCVQVRHILSPKIHSGISIWSVYQWFPKTHRLTQTTEATRVMPVVMKNQRKLGKDCRKPQKIVENWGFYAALPLRWVHGCFQK